MSENPSIPQNPYVGPRPFTGADPLFGRDVEKVELLNILISERIVLLYSPSGAGKTSLIQAGLVPGLEAEQFRPLPLIRVNREPSGANDISANRYVASAIHALEEGRADVDRIPAAELAGLTLDGYLRRLEADAPTGSDEPADPFVLIFDQFEEILTVDPADLADKEAFFAEVGAALLAPHRWALFAMREEYVAALDPYLRHLPTRLATTFRLGLLANAAAKEAIQKPAAAKGIAFTDPAVDALLADLLSARLPDGTKRASALSFVEPVQLQVVCRQFWESLPWPELPVRDGRPQIEAGHVAEHARVDDALAAYYADKVKEVVAAAGGDAPLALERQIREWIETNLITERGTRAQLRVGAEREQPLPVDAIAGLANAYLIRAEGRGDDRWYELAHDRLVQPVRENNAAWLSANLDEVQKRARQWDQSGRRPETLPRGAALQEAKSWLAANGSVLPAWEQKLLSEYVDAGLRKDRRRRLIGIALLLLAGLSVLLAVSAYRNVERQAATARLVEVTRQAEAARDQVLQQQEASASLANLAAAQLQAGRTDLALLLAVEAVEADTTVEAQRVLLDALGARPGLVTVLGRQASAPTAIAVNPQGTIAASAGCALETFPCPEGEIRLWDLSTRQPLAQNGDMPRVGEVSSLAFHPDGFTLAAGTADQGVILLDAASGQPLDPPLTGGERAVASVAFSPDGETLAVGGQRGAIELWEVASRELRGVLSAGHLGPVTALGFGQDGALASGGRDGVVLVWDDDGIRLRCEAVAEATDCEAMASDGTPRAGAGADGAPEATPVPGGAPLAMASVQSLSLSPNGRWLAAGTSNGNIAIWDAGSGLWHSHFSREPAAVLSVAFDASGSSLSAVQQNRATLRWDIGDLHQSGPSLAAGDFSAAAFAPNGDSFVAGDSLGEVAIWDMTQSLPFAQVFDAGSAVQAVAWSPDGAILATGGADGMLRLWDDGGDVTPAAQIDAGQAISSAAFSRAGSLAVSSASAVGLWDVGTGKRVAELPIGESRAIDAVAFSTDEQTLAGGGQDGAVLLWTVADPEAAPRVLAGHTAPVHTVAFSPTGPLLASGSADRTVRLWNLEQPDASPVVLSGRDVIASVAFDPAGQLLAAGGFDGNVWLWAPDSPLAVPAVLAGQVGRITSVAFSPDGRWLAAGGVDGGIQLWDVPSRGAVETLAGHTGSALAVSFTGERTLASGGEDWRAIVWSLGIASLQQDACRVVNRNLSQAEWEALAPDQPSLAGCAAILSEGVVTAAEASSDRATP